MTDDRHQRAKELFLAACDKHVEERAAFLEIACEGDVELRAEIEELLAVDSEQPSFLATPLLQDPAELEKALAGGEVDRPVAEPIHIGHYRVMRKLGEGGMGTVFEAEQEKPRRIVALKVLKPALCSESMLRRFEFEGHLLGRLQHPGIAQIFEAGMADGVGDPQPYLAMELVRGLPLTQHAQERRLTIADRVRLMAEVCDAIEHAHQKGIIHRDLKPSNILVTESGEPKVLDFGVARATDADANTERTQIGQVVGTLAYMSPEQALGDPDAIDTRCDVYALGIVLYELLSGRLPYEVRHRSLTEAARVIIEQQPERLGAIAPQLKGDLETIASKALAKDREQRYASVAALAADLRRFLRDEPIEARPPSSVYRLRKFAKRNKAVAAALTLAMLALVLGLASTSWQVHQKGLAEALAKHNEQRAKADQVAAEKARDEANAEKERAVAINRFLLIDVLAGPWGLGPEVKVRELLDHASQSLREVFAAKPDIEIGAREALAMSYRQIGALDKARSELERAIEMRRSRLGAGHPETLQAMRNLVGVLAASGDYQQAVPLARTVVEGRTKAFGEDDPFTLSAMQDLAGVTYYLDQQHGVQLLKDVVAREKQVLGVGHEQTVHGLNNLCSMLKLIDRLDEAEQFGSEAVDAALAHLGTRHPETLTAQQILACLYHDMGRLEEAESMFRELIEVYEPWYGDAHPATLLSKQSLARTLIALKRADEAHEILATVVEVRTRLLGLKHLETLLCVAELADCCLAQNDLDCAERNAREVLDHFVVSPQRELVVQPRAFATLGRVLMARRDFTGAEKPLREAMDLQEHVVPIDHQTLVSTQVALGSCYTHLTRFEEAEALLNKAYRSAAKMVDARDAMSSVIRALVSLYEAWGKPDRAAEWQARDQ